MYSECFLHFLEVDLIKRNSRIRLPDNRSEQTGYFGMHTHASSSSHLPPSQLLKSQVNIKPGARYQGVRDDLRVILVPQRVHGMLVS